MAMTRRTAYLLARQTCQAAGKAIGRLDGRQVREGFNWLVTREAGEIVTYRVDADPSRIAVGRTAYPEPWADHLGNAVPTADGLVVCGRHAVVALAPDGAARWRFDLPEWDEGRGGANGIGTTRSGRHVIVAAQGTYEDDGSYPGDMCFLLDATNGRLLGQHVLESIEEAYFRLYQPLAGPDFLLLSAAQGQDPAHAYIVTADHERLSVTPAGGDDEPVAALSPAGDALLTIDRGGETLQWYPVAPTGSGAKAAEVWVSATGTGSEDDQFVGRPGDVDDSTVIAAVAEEWYDTENSRHFLLDSTSLEVLAESGLPLPHQDRAASAGRRNRVDPGGRRTLPLDRRHPVIDMTRRSAGLASLPPKPPGPGRGPTPPT